MYVFVFKMYTISDNPAKTNHVVRLFIKKKNSKTYIVKMDSTKDNIKLSKRKTTFIHMRVFFFVWGGVGVFSVNLCGFDFSFLTDTF